MYFDKFVATGNDFFFIDARTPAADDFLARLQLTRSRLAARLCDRHYGAGADGVVFVEQEGSGLKWDFYNSDGSDAEMCGNAARCMGRWAQRMLKVEAVDFLTPIGAMMVSHSPETDDFTAHFARLELNSQKLPLPQAAPSGVRAATLLQTGVPHTVLVVDDLKRVSTELSLKRESEMFRELRFPALAGPRGANITLLEIAGDRVFSSVTFERGVEDFTLSCGTGVLAAAATGLQNASQGFEAIVKTPGGTLKAKFAEHFQSAVLIGPARFVYRAKLDEEFCK